MVFNFLLTVSATLIHYKLKIACTHEACLSPLSHFTISVLDVLCGLIL